MSPLRPSGTDPVAPRGTPFLLPSSGGRGAERKHRTPEARSLSSGSAEASKQISRPFYTKAKCYSLSRVRLFATLGTIARQAPPSVGVSRQETGAGSLSPLQGSHPGLPHCRQIPYQLSCQGSPQSTFRFHRFLAKYLGHCDGACVLLTSEDRGHGCCYMPYKVQDHVPSYSSAKK